MNMYKVFFEICGKKLCVLVEAPSRYDAEENVRDKLQINEVRLIEGFEKPRDNKVGEDFMKNPFGDLFGMFGGKK